ncbi:MAG: TraB/GumN family protein, partial [Ruminococcus sp.]|nr:TraB/GumN family protein [Ruminococcus sp.]
LPADLQDDYADYMDVMLYNRNKGMADKASEFLKEGKNYLFMVGSAHYAGDRGVDDLLEEMGYTVEKIS